jgi:hypothetical protein
MKSIQVSIHIPQSEQYAYSDLCVMKSAAGWYVGTIHSDPKGFQEPGSRDTDYFATEKDAKFVLELLERLNTSEGYKSSLWSDQQEYITCMFDSILHELNLNPRNVGYRLDP